MGSHYLLAASLSLALAASSAAWCQDSRYPSSKAEGRIAREVRHELVTLPYYSQVVLPVLKTDAERAVKGIEGVEKVVNNIEVLPLSPNDDRIRRAIYRAIYSQPGLDMYGLRAVPTIHIIVKNGNVTLAGAVGNQADKTRAEIAARGVSGAFSVTNDLLISP